MGKKGTLMYAGAWQARRRRIRAKVGGALAAGGLALAAVGVFGMSPAASASAKAGDATVIDPANTKPLGSGTKTTDWSLALPTHAACSGDTATGGYHVYGFIIPASGSEDALTFDPINGPTTPALPLFDVTGSAYGPANTDTSTGAVKNPLPTFNFIRFTSTDLPAGNYRVGVACAKGTGALDKFWNVPVAFDATLGWTATNPSGGSGGTTTTTTTPGQTTTTTTGSGQTTTTTAPVGDTTTTTVVSASTTVASTDVGATTTTAAGAVSTASTGDAHPATLAATGSPSVILVIFGVVLFSVGLVIVALSRRQTPVDLPKSPTT
jgi:hypothetical protein